MNELERSKVKILNFNFENRIPQIHQLLGLFFQSVITYLTRPFSISEFLKSLEYFCRSSLNTSCKLLKIIRQPWV